MIAKPYKQQAVPTDPRLRAGIKAEGQMAHYLHRAFSNNPETHVLHGLRLEDRQQPEQNGSPGVCQTDHLIVHRWGMFIIESKSVTEEVRVRPDNTGGDQWSRVYQGRESGMPSPIQQARRQAGFLRTFLERHREQLLGKPSVGMRTLARLVTGKDHGGFLDAPIQLLIAISDKGRIKFLDGWTEPQEPFRDFVTKADLVPDKIAEELERHRKGATSLGKSQGEYGLWDIEDSVAKAVAEFLAEHHAEPSGATAPRTKTKRAVPIQSRQPLRKRPTPDASTANKAVCKHCRGKDLTARWGQFGYYWRCGGCGKNTAMPKTCSRCGATGSRGNSVRIRTEKGTYFRECKACDTSERIWVEK